jgi:hypothetical protein
MVGRPSGLGPGHDARSNGTPLDLGVIIVRLAGLRPPNQYCWTDPRWSATVVRAIAACESTCMHSVLRAA